MNPQADNQADNTRKTNHHVEAGIRALADSLGEGLAVIQEGRIVYINETLMKVTGVSRDTLIDRKLTEIFSDSFEHRQYFEMRDRREQGEILEIPAEVRFKISTGRILEMRNRSSTIEWGGKPATVHFLEDITRRKETERLLVQQTEVNTILTDTVGRILASPLSLDETAGTVLDSAMGLTGSRSGVLLIVDRNERLVLQHRCQTACANCTLPEVLETILADPVRMARSRPGRFEGSFYLNEEIVSESEIPKHEGLRNLLRVPAGNIDKLSGQIILAGAPDSYGPWDLDAMEKVSEVLNLALVRHHAVEDLRRAKDMAEEEASSRSQFMANVTHEVRSPLNGVLMMASLLQDSELDADQSELLGVVMFSARTIDRLIRDLTDINQIRAGKFTVYNAEFNLGELLRHVLETHRPEAMRKGLLLDFSIAPEVNHHYGDRERIGQIVANLLVNAIRYTSHGSVRLEACEENNELVIDVIDTGSGIPEEKQKDVFRMFRQLDRQKGEKRDEGSGIGLAVVQELTDAMNGRIDLESVPGKGSRFTVLLPRTSPVEKPEPAARTHTVSHSIAVPRILVAEDEGVNRLYLRTFLEKENCLVDEAIDGLEALALAKQNEYDLILMDINMPQMDGLEASLRIREAGISVPIVAITAHAFGEDRFHILQAGLDEIVRKPFDGDDLNICLNRYIRN